MKKIIMLLLGGALIAGVTVFLVKPKAVTQEVEQPKNNVGIKETTDDKAPSVMHISDSTKNARNITKKESSSEQEGRLYTKEELDDAVSKAELEMAERVMRETMSPDQVTKTANSVVDAFEASKGTAESSANQAAINNYIHENGVYDKLAEKGVAFSGVECREAACKLQFEVSDTDDSMESRMPKMMSIDTELSDLGILEDMEAVITNDFEGRSLQYYYY